MANDKEIIRKLIKIADNQQKIINKLAQQIGTAPASPMGGATDDYGFGPIMAEVKAALAKCPSGAGANVTSAEALPEGCFIQLRNVANSGVTKELLGLLANQSVKLDVPSSDGKTHAKLPDAKPGKFNIIAG